MALLGLSRLPVVRAQHHQAALLGDQVAHQVVRQPVRAALLGSVDVARVAGIEDRHEPARDAAQESL